MSKKRESAPRRALRMARLGAGVTGNYLGYLAQSVLLNEEARHRKLKGTHQKAARKITSELMSMGGTAMKLGQTLSLQTHALPDEALAELLALQMKAPGMHPTLVRVQIKSSLGAEPESLFARFEEEPFAAASLGQVHRATLRSGEKVAVKVQYPGIRETIQTDFAWFRTVSKPAQLTEYLPAELIDELQEQITAELDYIREADNLLLLGNELSGLSWLEIPRLYPEYCSDRVLTMSFVEGMHLEEFLRTRPSRALRDEVGEHLLELLYAQVLKAGAFHADPHWGNYFFRSDGSVGLVDFGCVKYLAPAFVANLHGVFLYEGPRDGPEFRRLLRARYAPQSRVSARALDALVAFSRNFYGRVYPPGEEADQQAYDFSDPDLIKHYMRETSRITRAKGALREYVLFARAETGLYQTLHRLRARVRTSHIVRKYLNPGAPTS
jgi:predicted unusual protein kinase regulating ubiquinone biosynthesis (AarF/ABC1/UbiB family)